MSDVQQVAFRGGEAVAGVVARERLREGPVVDLGAVPRPSLRSSVAVVPMRDVPADALPGDVARAIRGLFLAVEVIDAGVLLGEQLLPLDASGTLRLHLGGVLSASGAIADGGDPVTRVAEAAAEAGGLRARDVVLLGTSAAAAPAQPGTLLLEGPAGATLCADLRGVA